MATLIFLHTSSAHLPTFAALAEELAPDLPLRQVVAEELLAEARAGGLTEALAGRVAAALRAAAGADGGAALCTCSTVGGLAEAAGAALGLPVLRVDRAMAARAVQLAAGAGAGPAAAPGAQSAAPPRIAVVAALASTLGPTRRLLEEEAARAGRPVALSAHLCAGAWPHFEAGDQAGYLALVAECARAAAAGADVVVLAQASMAGAADLLADLPAPVLSSPRLGVAAAAARCRRP